MNAADILAGGARLVRTQPKALSIWAALYVVVCLGAFALVWPMFSDLMAFQQQAVAAQSANLPPPPPPDGFFGGILLLDGVLLLLLTAIFAAAVRAVAMGGDDAFGFLRFGGDELRLIGLFFVLCLICVGMFVVVMIVFAIVIAVVGIEGGSSGPEPGGLALLVGAALYFALLAASVWAQVRISLAGAYTVLRGRIVIREAWRATRGRFWTLFGVYLLIFVVYGVVSIALIAIMNPALLTAYAAALQGHPEAMSAVVIEQQANMFGPRMIVAMILGTAFGMVLTAFIFGAIATAAIGFDEADRA